MLWNEDGMTASKATLPLKNTKQKTDASLYVTPARCSSNISLSLLYTEQEIWSISKENKLFWNDLIVANSD